MRKQEAMITVAMGFGIAILDKLETQEKVHFLSKVYYVDKKTVNRRSQKR